MRRFIMSILLGTLASGTSHAQSFDCRKANEPTDVAICRNPDLSEIDTRLGITWKEFQAARPELVEQAKSDGRAWYRRRQLCSKTPEMVACIREAELSRIQELTGKLASGASRAQSSDLNLSRISNLRERTSGSPYPNNEGGRAARELAKQDSDYYIEEVALGNADCGVPTAHEIAEDIQKNEVRASANYLPYEYAMRAFDYIGETFDKPSGLIIVGSKYANRVTLVFSRGGCMGGGKDMSLSEFTQMLSRIDFPLQPNGRYAVPTLNSDPRLEPK